MQTFVTLVRLRDASQPQTQSSSLRSPSQIVSDAVKQAKGKVLSQHATLGFYDLVIVAEYPDTQSAFKAGTILKTQHQWIPETMLAEELSQFDSIYNEAQRETTSSRSSR